MAVSKDDVVAVLKKCYDPEIPINIYDLGLVYDIDIGEARIGGKMTLTAPGGPAAAYLRRAPSLVTDPRVKFIFGRAADEYGRALKSLEGVPGGKAKGKAPEVFPFDAYDRIECSVYGYETTGDEIPERCPSCDAVRYAFERDVKREEAWDLVARTTKESLALARKAAKGVTTAEAGGG